MANFSRLIIASAVAAALAAPAVLAQTGATSQGERGATEVNPSPSGQPNPSDRMSRRGSTAGTGSGTATSEVERNPTDIRPGGQTNAGTDPASRAGSMKHGHYSSATVRDAQQALQGKGYDVGESDGVMGPRTQAAIRDFQQQQGLPVSGRLDRATRSALNVSSTGLGPTSRTN